MGKTSKCKDKAKAKTAKVAQKIARKCKGGKLSALLAAFALAFLAGCASSESAQPAKSQTLTADLDGCTIIIAGKVSMPIAGTNQTITAEGEKLPTIELLTQTQSLESTGTDSYAQTATQTPTTDVKPDVDLHYNDAVGKGGGDDGLDDGGILGHRLLFFQSRDDIVEKKRADLVSVQ